MKVYVLLFLRSLDGHWKSQILEEIGGIFATRESAEEYGSKFLDSSQIIKEIEVQQ